MSTVFSRFISVLNIPFIYAQEVKHHFDESENISPYLPYGKEGPKVTENSAVQLINRYCGTLPQDKFSNLNPEIEDDDEIPIVNYTPNFGAIHAYIYMLPICTYIHNFWYGYGIAIQHNPENLNMH